MPAQSRTGPPQVPFSGAATGFVCTHGCGTVCMEAARALHPGRHCLCPSMSHRADVQHANNPASRQTAQPQGLHRSTIRITAVADVKPLADRLHRIRRTKPTHEDDGSKRRAHHIATSDRTAITPSSLPALQLVPQHSHMLYTCLLVPVFPPEQAVPPTKVSFRASAAPDGTL